MNLFIAGASGFIGSALIKRLLLENVSLIAAVLAGEEAGHLPEVVEQATVEPLSESSDYTAALQSIDTVIHLAARVHVMQEAATDPLQEFRKVNLHGTERLARQAAQAGVSRFVFMSTIGVNGDNSSDKPYTEGDVVHPHNAYSVSKYEAELVLTEISKQTGMEVVIIRAPLVYGPGNPGNFLSLLRIVSKGFPLPLASITNKRSLIYVGNLVDALATCAIHPSAAGKTYLISDGEDISTPDLIRRTASALGVPARLIPFPVSLMLLAGKLTDKSGAVNRLTGSLTVDSSKIRRELGWMPPFTMEEGLVETAAWFRNKF
ncbi:nucleoside-diphosphate-sugar epimerase [Geobacter argillaceus]|uniref:Nucleoside-diphosphate-sugar epimerase n=2 Tax=Geobacter argillaceus TaxID=345631 RepID=A0A562W8D5_9BACT|nr:nucleoside-diphosphate-sugar epimerase [Geobacter argillaceus]